MKRIYCDICGIEVFKKKTAFNSLWYKIIISPIGNQPSDDKTMDACESCAITKVGLFAHIISVLYKNIKGVDTGKDPMIIDGVMKDLRTILRVFGLQITEM